jgi:hypothetical protein
MKPAVKRRIADAVASGDPPKPSYATAGRQTECADQEAKEYRD